MPRNGSGVFSLASGNPVVTGTTVQSTWANNTLSDIASALTASVATDGQTPMSANLPMGGNRITGLANGASSTEAATVGQLTAALPTGTLLDFAGTVVPSGFLACDGSAVSRITYSTLFTALGTTWGAGDGSTTFNVPDLRRRTTIGSGGTAVAGPANTVGAVGGEETHVLTTAELAAHNHVVNISDPQHSHTITDPQHSHSSATGVVRNISPTATAFNVASTAGNIDPNNPSQTSLASTGITGTNTATTGITATSNNNGSGTAHNTMQPSAVVNKIIKT